MTASAIAPKSALPTVAKTKARLRGVRGARLHLQIEDDRVMIGGPAAKHPGVRAVQSSRHAPIQTKGNDVASNMGRLRRPDVLEARQLNRAHGIVVSDNYS